MATGCDWLPTIAEICGCPLPNRKIDGKSLVPVIASADAPSPHEVFYWQLFLVNLADDVSEMTNLAPKHPDVVARLKKIQEAYVEEIQSP